VVTTAVGLIRVAAKKRLAVSRVAPNFPFDTAEAEMAGRGVDRLGVTRRWPVASAIVRCAKMRAALNHLARDLALGLARILAVLRVRAARIEGPMQHECCCL